MNPLKFIIPPLASQCNHSEKWVNENESFCKKCGRIRLVDSEKGVTLFFYCNKVKYLTLKGGIKNG